MATFVADASVTLSWCFEDEATSWTDELLNRLRAGDTIAVPAHWPTEVSNGLLVAVRRKRIAAGKPELFWDELARFPIEVEPPLSPAQAKLVLGLSQQYGLTVYDAAYLELSLRRSVPLATSDSALAAGASAAEVELISAAKL